MHEESVSFEFKGRYFKLGDINPSTKQVWFVLHGYGQLARYFIRKFEILVPHNVCVIAPEALSHFYLKDVTSRMATGNTRVGASWMTKENRLTDIANYITFLNAIYRKEMENNIIPVTVLGFSQGAATASRWIAHQQIQFTKFVLWAGVFPPDMDLGAGQQMLKEKEIYLVRGNSDPFIGDERFAEMEKFSNALNIRPKQLHFEGGHTIDGPTLLKLL